EDGIRDFHVTGVQTCALPICNIHTDATNLLIMNDNAAVTSVSDAAYVHGPVRKIGNDSFTFPIGKDGFYRPASISSPVNAAHHRSEERRVGKEGRTRWSRHSS